MTVREFIEFLWEDCNIEVYEHSVRILKIYTSYLGSVKEELLDREIEKRGVEVSGNFIRIYLKPKEPSDE